MIVAAHDPLAARIQIKSVGDGAHTVSNRQSCVGRFRRYSLPNVLKASPVAEIITSLLCGWNALISG
jgi:hypothetical protein